MDKEYLQTICQLCELLRSTTVKEWDDQREVVIYKNSIFNQEEVNTLKKKLLNLIEKL